MVCKTEPTWGKKRSSQWHGLPFPWLLLLACTGSWILSSLRCCSLLLASWRSITLERGTGCGLPDEPVHCNQTGLSLISQCQGSRRRLLLTQCRKAQRQAVRGVTGDEAGPQKKKKKNNWKGLRCSEPSPYSRALKITKLWIHQQIPPFMKSALVIQKPHFWTLPATLGTKPSAHDLLGDIYDTHCNSGFPLLFQSSPCNGDSWVALVIIHQETFL